MGLVQRSRLPAMAAVTAVALAVPAAAQPRASAHRHARLSLAGASPLSIRGAGFHRRERVRVVVRAPGERVRRRVRATAGGTFRVSFGAAPQEPCVRFSVSAMGSLGSRAVLPGIKLPDCIVR
jgi:hypothetical protein